MRCLDLFSGIGGMALGLERAGIETVAFCEVEPACRFWLREHWPRVPIYEDVRSLTGERVLAECGSVDLVAGGFPCQDISVAGKGAGIEGSRSGLWAEMFRLVRELRPAWVLAENVPALRTRGADRVLGDLEAEGYACWPLVVGADDVGAPHRRKRVWIVARLGLAHRDSTGQREQRVGGVLDGERQASRHDADGRGEWPVGDAGGEGLSLREGERHDARAERSAAERAGRAGSLADTEHAGLRSGGQQETPHAVGSGLCHWPGRPGEPQHEWEAPRLLDNPVRGGRKRQHGWPDAPVEAGDRENDGVLAPTGGQGFTESLVGSATDGLPPGLAGYSPAHRRAALRALGNAVVPQVVEQIGRAIVRARE